MRTKHPDFEDTYPTRPGDLSCPPCNRNCNEGRRCPAEACTEVGADVEPNFKAASHFWTAYLSILLAALAVGLAWLS